MIDTIENDFFCISQRKLHLTGEVDKSACCSCHSYSGFNIRNIIKIGYFRQRYSKIKGGRFWDTAYISDIVSTNVAVRKRDWQRKETRQKQTSPRLRPSSKGQIHHTLSNQNSLQQKSCSS